MIEPSMHGALGRRPLVRLALSTLLALVATLTPIVYLTACTGLGGPPRLTFTQADIARALERQFPQDRRMLEVLDVTMRSPQVRLLAERNRVAAVLDIAVHERLLGGRWSGRLDFDAALRWEAGDRTLRLHQVRVAELRSTDPRPGAPGFPGTVSTLGANAAGPAATPAAGPLDTRGTLERLGAALAERALEDLAIYTLPPERADALRA